MAPRARKTAATPGRAPRRSTRGRTAAIRPKMPFSLILEPGELQILRSLADRENTSVAAVIRKALHTVIFKNHPDLARATIENEVESFLNSVGNKLPSGIGGTAKRAQLRKELVAKLLKKKGKGKK